MGSKHCPGDRIIFRGDADDEVGRITSAEGRSYSIKSDTKKLYSDVDVRRIKGTAPDTVLILESSYERRLNGNREYAATMKRIVESLGHQAFHERIHSEKDLVGMLQHSRATNIRTRFIHIMSHGHCVEKTGEAALSLTLDKEVRLKGMDWASVRLDGKIVVFSCCDVGRDSNTLSQIKRETRAAAVIAYRATVGFWFTLIAENILYAKIVHEPNTKIETHVATVNRMLADGKFKHVNNKAYKEYGNKVRSDLLVVF